MIANKELTFGNNLIPSNKRPSDPCKHTTSDISWKIALSCPCIVQSRVFALKDHIIDVVEATLDEARTIGGMRNNTSLCACNSCELYWSLCLTVANNEQNTHTSKIKHFFCSVLFCSNLIFFQFLFLFLFFYCFSVVKLNSRLCTFSAPIL